MTQVFESPTGSSGNVGGIVLGGWDRTKVVLSTLVFIECQSSNINAKTLARQRVPR